MLEFPAEMFPHSVVPQRATWATDDAAGLEPTDTPGAAIACNVIETGSESDPTFASADSMSSRRLYRVSFPADPTLAIGDTLAWQGMSLVVLEPSKPAARGRLYRVLCSHTT